MDRSIPSQILLLTAGLIAAIVGGAILSVPVAFYATMDGVDLAGDVNLLNETRAAGGALLGAGAVIGLGAFVRRLTFTSFVICSALYLSYGASRLLSILVDGVPTPGLVGVAVLELGVGLISAVALARSRPA